MIIVRRMRFARWISKATDTHSECAILIAYSLQHLLRERPKYYFYTTILIHTAVMMMMIAVNLQREISCACKTEFLQSTYTYADRII